MVDWAALMSQASGGDGNEESADPYDDAELQLELQPPSPDELGPKQQKKATKALRQWISAVLDKSRTEDAVIEKAAELRQGLRAENNHVAKITDFLPPLVAEGIRPSRYTAIPRC